MNQVLYRVYRPSVFADLIGQKHISTTIQNQFAMRHLSHAYLFTGPRGVGKTTTARLVAKLANCEQPINSEPCNECNACIQIISGTSLDVYEIDAASNTDVEHVRENIIKSVRFAPNLLKKKVFIIDEVHMLSTSAFNALLKTLEEPPAYVLFILATTEIHKVPETIISRCQRFDFKRIPKDDMLARLRGIATQEKIDVDEDVLEEVVKRSDGCARDAESLLGQILALGEKKISLAQASLVLPASTTVQLKIFLEHLFEKDACACIDDLNTFLEQGIDLKTFLEDLLFALRDQLFDSSDTLFIRQALLLFLDAKVKIRSEHLPQLPVELAILELCAGEWEERQRKEKKEERKKEEGQLEDFNQRGVGSVSVEKAEKVEMTEKVVDETIQETVFDAIPILSLDEVREKWPKVFDQIRECNASLPLFMQSCEVSGVSGEQVELGFEFDLYVQTVNKDKNRLVIEQALEHVLGKKMKVRAIASKKSHAPDEVINGLLQQFGGTVS